MKKFIEITAIIAVISISLFGRTFAQSEDLSYHNPFVYMRNDKFFYETEPYYLKTCNYLIDMFMDDDNQLVVIPSINYFDKWNNTIPVPENQEDGYKYFKSHFIALKKMGFNSIRVMGCQVQRRWDTDILATCLFFKDHKTIQNPDPAKKDRVFGARDWEILMDLESENGKEYYKQAMHVVLDAAEECGLKVIWVIGHEKTYVDENNNAFIRSLLTSSEHTINQQFCSFLQDVAIEFKNNSTLIGYDLFNELQSFNGEDGCSNEYELSETVKVIVSTIKNVDQNHFITVGLHSIRAFFILGVEPFKHCDVYSFHIYEGEYEAHMPTNGGQTNRQLYYFNKTIDFPWMIGETGTNSGKTLESELDQRYYASVTLQQSKNCNSIGYSWWQLYDDTWGTERLGILRCKGGHEEVLLSETDDNYVSIYGDYKSIVDYDHCGTECLDSSVFNYSLSQNNCTFLSTPYYYSYPPVPENSKTLKWKGKVVSNGTPIENAVVKVSVRYPTLKDKLSDFYTFTKSDGTFDIKIPTNDNLASITVGKYGYTVSETKSVLNWLSSYMFTKFNINSSILPPKESHVVNYLVNEGESKIIREPTMITGRIYVNTGSELTIKCPVYFNDDSKIIVSPGGKLILEDGAVLTAIHKVWGGIILNSNESDGVKPEIISSENAIINKVQTEINSY